MNSIFQILLYTHIVSGFLSLILFWIPVFTRKGGNTHRKTGIWYVRFMWIVVITAAILSVKNLVIGRVNMGIFLGFISLITANPLWYGIAILKHKKSTTKLFRTTHIAFRVTIVVTAIMMVAYGIIGLGGKNAAMLMFVFGGLGIADLPGVIQTIRNKTTKVNWFKEHLVGMCVSGIAAYTAFFVFGANQFLQVVLSGYWMVLPWILPTIIGVIGIRLSVKRYSKGV